MSFEGLYPSEPLALGAFEDSVGSLLQVARSDVRPLFAHLVMQKEGQVAVDTFMDILTEMQGLYLPYSARQHDEELQVHARKPGQQCLTGSTTIPDSATPGDSAAESGAE